MKIIYKFLHPACIAFVAGLLLVSCNKNQIAPVKTAATESISGTKLHTDAVSLTQGFEVGATSPKTAYDVTPTGSSSAPAHRKLPSPLKPIENPARLAQRVD